jgi:hypothetical protein
MSSRLPLSFGSVFCLFAVVGCSADFRPVIASVNPLNGATAVGTDFQPVVTLASDVDVVLEEGDRHLVLIDLTDQKRTISGQILIEDEVLTYQPNDALQPNHRYEIVVEQGIASGDKLLDVDGSEWPEEPLTWPFRAQFATFSAPRVRAVYLDRDRARPRLYIRFSQPMNQATADDKFKVIDNLGNELTISRPIWVDASSARLDITAELALDKVYKIQVDGAIQANDGTKLDGDGDWVPGEAKDSFTTEFTGSEEIVLSRLSADKQ